MTPTNTPAAAIWLEAAKVAEDITSANVQARRDRADDALAFEFDGLGKVIVTALRERAKIAGDAERQPVSKEVDDALRAALVASTSVVYDLPMPKYEFQKPDFGSGSAAAAPTPPSIEGE